MSKHTIELTLQTSADVAASEKTKELKFLLVITYRKKSKGFFFSDQIELANAFVKSTVLENVPGITEAMIEAVNKEGSQQLGVKKHNLVILNIIQLAG